MKWRQMRYCWMGQHEWGEWQEARLVAINSSGSTDPRPREYRVCDMCHCAEVRDVESAA